MKILLIEDDDDTRMLTRKALRVEDYEVHEAANGNEAFHLMTQGLQPDVILLDLSLPDMGGEQFLKRIRSHPEWQKIRVVLVSGWPDLKMRARQMGADDALRKPFDLDELYRIVELHAGGLVK